MRPRCVGGDGGKVELENGGDAAVGVVGLLGAEDSLAGRKLAGNPQGFKVGDGAAGGEMAEELPSSRTCRAISATASISISRAGAAAVAGVVVGVDGHGQRVGGARDGMRRLEHLPGVEGMEVGIVVAEAVGDGVEDLRHGSGRQWRRLRRGSKAGKRAELRLERLQWRRREGRERDRWAWRPYQR